jgi:hypothetical protein
MNYVVVGMILLIDLEQAYPLHHLKLYVVMYRERLVLSMN